MSALSQEQNATVVMLIMILKSFAPVPEFLLDQRLLQDQAFVFKQSLILLALHTATLYFLLMTTSCD